MGNVSTTMENNTSRVTLFSDDDDLRLFQSLGGPDDLARKIVRIKHDNPEVTSLLLKDARNWSETAWRRLGDILGRSKYLKEFHLVRCNVEGVGLFAGLQHNQSISKIKLAGINLRGIEQMSSLAPFLTLNPCLKAITLRSCNLGPVRLHTLSNALLERSDDTLVSLNLNRNNFGGVYLDELVVALSRCRKLSRLYLDGTGIGRNGCASLARLLESQDTNLEYLWLTDNAIDDESVDILVNSLTKNTKLRTIGLVRNSGITAEGWSALLKFVCDGSSIDNVTKSSNTLRYVGMLTDEGRGEVNRALGVDDANLLHASLKINDMWNKMLVTRIKILWSHARGSLNLGEASIVAGVMPHILAWFTDNSSSLVQYRDPSLPKARIDSISIDAIYRILLSRPDLVVREASRDGRIRDETMIPFGGMRDKTMATVCMIIFGMVLLSWCVLIIFGMVLLSWCVLEKIWRNASFVVS